MRRRTSARGGIVSGCKIWFAFLSSPFIVGDPRLVISSIIPRGVGCNAIPALTKLDGDIGG